MIKQTRPQSLLDSEPEPEPDVDLQRDQSKSKGKRRATDNLRRDLSDEDLSSPGVQKLLLDALDRLENELDEKKIYQDKFYQCDKNIAVLNEKMEGDKALRLEKTNKSMLLEISCMVSLAFGGVFMGGAPSISKGGFIEPWIVYGLGIALIGYSVFIKWCQK